MNGNENDEARKQLFLSFNRRPSVSSQNMSHSLAPPRREVTLIREKSQDELWIEEVSSLPMAPETKKATFDTSNRSLGGEGGSDGDITSSFGSIGQIILADPTKPNSTMRSQEEVQRRFVPLLQQQNKVYRKSITSFIRRANKGETIVTVIDGKPETRYEVKDDTSYVVCGSANEHYVITKQNFQENYDETSAKPITASIIYQQDNGDGNNDEKKKQNGPSNKPFFITENQIVRFHKAGFLEYRSKRKVWAYKVTIEDMKWFQNREKVTTSSTTPYGMTESYFMAPWRESMRVELGDFLVMTYPYNNDEVYRVECAVFGQSYAENSVYGHFKDLAIMFRLDDVITTTKGGDDDLLKRNEIWTKVRDLLKDRGNDEMKSFAEIRDADGRTALHIAIAHDAPWEIMEILFYAAPNVLTDVELRSFVRAYRGNKELKRNALHLSCLNSAPHDVVELIYKKLPKTVTTKDAYGWFPLHFACKAKELNHSTIKILTKADESVLTKTNSNGVTPLIQAIDHEKTNYEIIYSLTTEEAAKMADPKGRLPLHHACIKGLPQDILELLLLIYPDSISHKDETGRTPFQCALENAGFSPNGPATIKFLVDMDKSIVNIKGSNGCHALTFLHKEASGRSLGKKSKEKRARCSDSLKYILEANPHQDFNFFKALESISSYLQEDVFIHTLQDENLSERQKHIQLDIFFSTFRPSIFSEVMISSLDSKYSETCRNVCMDWMNKQSCKRSVVFSLMMQLYMHCTWIGLLIAASTKYVTFSEKRETYRSLAIALIPFALLFFLLEVFQFTTFYRTGAAGSYLTDAWNFLDLITIALVLASASRLITVEARDGTTDRLLIATGWFIFLELVSFLKKMFLPFAIFVSGTLKIFVKLIPFGVSTFLVLSAFAFMYFVDRYDPNGNDVNEDDSYQTLLDSFLSVFSSFVGEPARAQNWLDIFFGIVTVVVLLNVVIAIVSREWEDATRKASRVFWRYRLDFLQEISRGFRAKMVKQEEKRKTKIGKLDNVVQYTETEASTSLVILGSQEETEKELPYFFATISLMTTCCGQLNGCCIRGHKEKMHRESQRIGTKKFKFRWEDNENLFKAQWVDDDAAFWTYFVHRCMYVCFVLAGLVSFGQLWPIVIRRRIFEATLPKSRQSDDLKQNLLERVDELDKKSSEIRADMDSRMNRLEEKMDLLLDKLSKLTEPSKS